MDNSEIWFKLSIYVTFQKIFNKKQLENKLSVFLNNQNDIKVNVLKTIVAEHL